jgi:hypothetical protein
MYGVRKMPAREKFSELLKKGWSLHRRLDNAMVFVNDDGELELWQKNDGVASYAIVFEGHDYEFCSGNADYITRVIEHDGQKIIPKFH